MRSLAGNALKAHSKEIAAQFHKVVPVAQAHVCHYQCGHRYQRQDRPTVSDAERALGEPHQQQPTAAQYQHTQPGMEEKLGEITTDIGKETSWHHHLLAEEERGVEEQVVLLDFP